ncbi:MAG TPA: hypothetical protein VF026_23875 [Ktedonobacteraceae bacterium]
MADNRINQASWDLVNSLQDTNQAVANSVVATQEHYLKFTQSLFLSGTEVLENQIESTRNLTQEWGKQAQKQQEAVQRLAYATLDLYTNFLRTPFSFYQKMLDVTTNTALQGLENGQRATRQTIDTAENAAQRGLDQAQKAARQGHQAAQKSGE